MKRWYKRSQHLQRRKMRFAAMKTLTFCYFFRKIKTSKGKVERKVMTLLDLLQTCKSITTYHIWFRLALDHLYSILSNSHPRRNKYLHITYTAIYSFQIYISHNTNLKANFYFITLYIKIQYFLEKIKGSVFALALCSCIQQEHQN